MFKKTLVASTLALASLAAQASAVVSIDPDGTASGNGAYSVAGLDWNAGTVLVKPTGVNNYGLPASANAAQPNVGDVFQSYAQASLSQFNGNIGAIAVNGLNSTYEWTFIAGFREVVSNFIGVPGFGTAIIDTISGGDNFFRVYSSAVDSNNLAGTGFSNGTLIMEGKVLPYTGGVGGRTAFTTTNNYSNKLDNYGTNDYAGISSVIGNGSATLDLQVTAFDADFIQGLSVGQIMSMSFDTSVGDPFRNTNPSAKVTDGNGNLVDATSLASVGPVNGISGPNFVLQSDGTSSFDVNSIPEPTSLALVSMAMLGLGASRRRAAK